MATLSLLPRAVLARVKPRLRGVSHELACYASICAGALMVAFGRPDTRLALLVYAVCQSAMLGISAVYHRPTWQPQARAWMRRLDHAGIYLQVAGTYTPLCLLALGGERGKHLIAIIWLVALAGIVKSALWAHAPKWLNAGLYVVMGWAMLVEWPAVRASLTRTDLTLLFTGGGLYTVGALIYMRRWPDPLPAVFGYHEIFHLLVVLAAACHYAMVGRIAGLF